MAITRKRLVLGETLDAQVSTVLTATPATTTRATVEAIILEVAGSGGGGGGGVDAEGVRDVIGTALVGSGLVSVTVDDAGNTITLSTSATSNATDAQLRDRATHTGAQAISTVTGLQAALDAKSATSHSHTALGVSDFTAAAKAAVPDVVVFSQAGNAAVGAGNGRWYNDSGVTKTITGVRVNANPAPTGAALIVDVDRNGTTIYGTQANRPTIAIGGNTSGVNTGFTVTTVANGDYLTVDIDQVGSTATGGNVVAQITLVG